VAELNIHLCIGLQVAAYLDDVARLRIEVFRDFPYLYDGDLAYERDYLSTYSTCDQSLFVLVEDAGRIVGASSGLPLAAETAEFQQPLADAGHDVSGIFYFGESVLLPAYRGRGLGHRFFDQRERYARSLGFTLAAFCAVQRPDDHPLRPHQYRPLDAFWLRRGYTKQSNVVAHFTWKDVDEAQPTAKPLVFWLRRLSCQPA
jgi:GNAT superfamily N-acetyltransferase